MTNNSVTYRVTGRYMDGQNVVGYHLVGADGSQACESRDRVIYLISMGIIDNMRTQSGVDGNIIIRGKGINLNTLPVFDMGKSQFRGDGMSQAAGNTQVSVNKSTTPNINQMGQFRIIKRVMQQNRCLGYEVQDYSGNVKRFSRNKVIELAVQRLICNAVANKQTTTDNNGQSRIDVVLRGVGCDINKLPILIADAHGNIIDPMKNVGTLSVRGAAMSRSGIISDTVRGKTLQFRVGDIIICEPSGSLSVRTKEDIKRMYRPGEKGESAVCDDYLGNCIGYSIEMFGSKPVQLNPNIIKSWAVLKPIGA